MQKVILSLSTDTNSGSATNSSTGGGTADTSDATAGLLAAAALWRHRFLQQPSERVSENNSAPEIKHTSAVDSSSESESGVASADVPGEAIADTGRATSGTKPRRARRNSGRAAGRRRSWNSARAKEPTSQECEERNEQTGAEEGPQLEKMGLENEDQAEPSQTSVACETGEEVNGHPETVEHNLTNLIEKSDQDDEKEPEPNTQNGKVHARKSPRAKTSTVTDENEEQETNKSGDQKEGQTLPESSLAVEHGEFSSVSGVGDQTEPVLDPWQEPYFNIEDVLKPVVKSRGSVRRSLRNRRSVDVQAGGLAWVDHTSPELLTASRRRTRSRLSAVFCPPALPDSEEPLTNKGEQQIQDSMI